MTNHVLIRVRRNTHANLKALCTLVAEFGWVGANLSGEGPATLCAVLESLVESELSRLRKRVKK